MCFWKSGSSDVSFCPAVSSGSITLFSVLQCFSAALCPSDQAVPEGTDGKTSGGGFPLSGNSCPAVPHGILGRVVHGDSGIAGTDSGSDFSQKDCFVRKDHFAVFGVVRLYVWNGLSFANKSCADF